MSQRSWNRLLERLALFTHLGILVALCVSALAQFINPNTFLIPAFFGLAFLPLVIVNILFSIGWLFIKPKFALVGLLLMAISWQTISRHIHLWPSEPYSVEEPGYELLSFNVRLFDLYNWGGNKKSRNHIVDYIDHLDPDIVCFQEFFNSNNRDYFNTLDTLQSRVDLPQVHQEFSSILHRGKSKFGIATVGKPVIIDRKKIPLESPGNNIAIYTDLLLGNDTLRIFNLHLASVYISSIELDLEEHIVENDQDAQVEAVGHMLLNLASGFKRRAQQVEVIRSYIDSSPFPVIVCADLNDTPSSYSYRVLRGSLKDAFIESGSGLGVSYIGRFPGLRIDYIFVDKRIQISEFRTEQVELSDHRPLWARIHLSQRDT